MQQMPQASAQHCGHPGAVRVSLWAVGGMTHGKVVTTWVSFPSRPRKPSWKWIPIVSIPFLPALSLTVLYSRSGCILGKLCLTHIPRCRESRVASFVKAWGSTVRLRAQ